MKHQQRQADETAMKIAKLMCIALLLLLVSCGVLSQNPPPEAVELAITQQLMHKQQSIAQTLERSSHANPVANLEPSFEIEDISVSSRTKVTDSEQLSRPEINEVYKVNGTFKAKLKAPGYPESSSPFEVYLGTNTLADPPADGVETWFLIQP